MTAKTRLAGLVAVIASLSLVACGTQGTGTTTPSSTSSSQAKVLEVGIAQIVSHPSLDAIREGFKTGMTEGGYVEGTDVRYDEQNPQGDQAALTSIANNFKSSNKDVIIAITTPVAQSMAQAISDKPIIFAGVTDPVAAKLIDSLEKPGGNLTGTSDYPPIAAQIELIREVKPSVKTIGIVYSSSEVNAEVQAGLAKDAAAKLGLEVRTATVNVSADVQQAANSLAGVDAFYVGNDNTVVSAMEALVQVAEAAKVPVITADPDSVARGATAAYAVDQFVMGKNAAKLAIKVLKGAKVADVPSERQTELELTINLDAAKRIGLELPASVIDRADNKV